MVDLYNCKGLHARALDLLEKYRKKLFIYTYYKSKTCFYRLGKQSDGPLRGVLPTIRYLQKLGLDHFDLVLQYSRWVLEKEPKHGMDVRYTCVFVYTNWINFFFQ